MRGAKFCPWTNQKMSVSETNLTSELSASLPLLSSEETAGNSVSAPSGWRDLLGVTASIACAIHCAAMPFIIGFLPAMGLSFLADEAFHKWMAGACFLIGLAAFVPGWRRHGRLLPAGIAACGLTIITFAAFGLSGECCPTCEAAAGSGAVAATDGDACTDENCTHCASETQTAAAATGSESPVCCDEKCEYCEEETVAAATKEGNTPACCKEGTDHGKADAAALTATTKDDTPACCKECEQSKADAPTLTAATTDDTPPCCKDCEQSKADAITLTAATNDDTPACCKECEQSKTEAATLTAATNDDTPACCEEGCDHGASQAAAALTATDESPVCTDEECAHCAAAAGSDSTMPTPEAPVAQAGFFATYAAWWTPLGGLLMVIGHLLNRSMVSSCSCCGTDDSCLTDSANLTANSTN